jgi:hypothetical protein
VLRSLNALLVISALAGFAAGGRAQGHPDFSGAWIIDIDKTAASAGRAARGRAGAPSTITQDAVGFVITRTNGAKTVYRFDGTEVRNRTPVIGGPDNAEVNAQLAARDGRPTPGTDEVYKSSWHGAKLVTTMTGRGASGPTMATETRWLESPWMVEEVVRKTPSGDTTRRAYWKKTKEPE